jgi:hypothetical protein
MAIADAELRLGERLIWAERAGSLAMARRALVLAIFGIPFTAFSVFWTYDAIKQEQAKAHNLAAVTIWGSMFVLVGLGLLLQPIIAAARARRTVYAVTDRRLVIITPSLRSARVDSYPLDSINILERTDRANGYGDIVFHKETEPTRVVKGFLYYEKQGGGVTRTGFFGIPEVRKVEEAIQRLAPGLSSNSPSAST